MPPGDNLVL